MVGLLVAKNAVNAKGTVLKALWSYACRPPGLLEQKGGAREGLGEWKGGRTRERGGASLLTMSRQVAPKCNVILHGA